MNTFLKRNKQKGFTLIELLIIIAIIAILAAIVFVAIDPARRLAEARNADRWGSTNAVLNGYLKYVVDNRGSAPTTTDNSGDPWDTAAYMIGTGTGTGSTCTATSTAAGFIDLSPALVDTYIASIPIDPLGVSEGWAAASSTKYYIVKSGNGRVTIGACEAERGETVSVTR